MIIYSPKPPPSCQAPTPALARNSPPQYMQHCYNIGFDCHQLLPAHHEENICVEKDLVQEDRKLTIHQAKFCNFDEFLIVVVKIPMPVFLLQEREVE